MVEIEKDQAVLIDAGVLFTPKRHRRDPFALKVLGAAAVFSAAIFSSDFKKEAVVVPSSTLHSQLPSNLEFGFNTHLTSKEGSWNLEIDAFRGNVDELANHGQTWIRFNILRWEAAALSTDGLRIIWNQEELKVYDEAIFYANEKGLKIFLVSTPPAVGQNYSQSDYLSLTKQYYEGLVSRYGSLVDVWQLNNEADIHHWADYGLLNSLSDEYLGQFAAQVGVAREVIKRADDNAIFTVNVSGWPLDERTENRWYKFLDSLRPYLDAVTLDIYVINDLTEIKRLNQMIDRLAQRYGLGVIIGELGVCTAGNYTQEDQASIIPSAIDRLKKAPLKSIIVYEIQDEGSDRDRDCESNFGIKNADGSKKSSFEKVMNSMR